MKKEYNSLEIHFIPVYEADIITASNGDTSKDDDITGGDIF